MTHRPERTCAGCGQVLDQDRLVRLVLSPDKTIELDYQRKLPGRGAWLFPNRQCFEHAQKRGGFNRAFKQGGVRFDMERIWEGLVAANRQRLIDSLNLARKAGALIVGGENLKAALKQGGVHAVLVVEDASENTVDRFVSKAKGRDIPVVRALTKATLGSGLGREIQAVAGITQAAFAAKLLREGAVYDAIVNRVVCQKTR